MMSRIHYRTFDQLNPDDFLPILNQSSLRTHLIDHQLFDQVSVRSWIDSKMAVDAEPGCRVRAVYWNDELVGWCGIQYEDNLWELAIVIEQRAWGIGKQLFKKLLNWASELGHKEVVIHLLETRRSYQFLQTMARKVETVELLGRNFTRYYLAI